jgi:hypothetical protein
VPGTWNSTWGIILFGKFDGNTSHQRLKYREREKRRSLG